MRACVRTAPRDHAAAAPAPGQAAKKRFDEDAEFKKRAHLAVVALQARSRRGSRGACVHMTWMWRAQAGDVDNLRLWQQLIDVSKVSYAEVYSRLSVHPDLQVCACAYMCVFVCVCVCARSSV